MVILSIGIADTSARMGRLHGDKVAFCEIEPDRVQGAVGAARMHAHPWAAPMRADTLDRGIDEGVVLADIPAHRVLFGAENAFGYLHTFSLSG